MPQASPQQVITKSIEPLTSGMLSILSQISSLVQSETETETAAIEKRYYRGISMAEGNTAWMRLRK